MQGQLLLSLSVGILVWLGALIIDLPFPLVLGILAALLELVPTIGPLIAVPVALVISAAVDSFRGEKPALLAWLGR